MLSEAALSCSTQSILSTLCAQALCAFSLELGQLSDVTSGHSHQVGELQTVEAVLAAAGQGLQASKDYLTLTHTPDRLGVLGWVDAADSA